MTAVIYARYSSDNQREESHRRPDPGVHGLGGKEWHHHRQALYPITAWNICSKTGGTSEN